MEDDRILQRAGALQKEIRFFISQICALPMAVWDQLATIGHNCEMDGLSLRDDVLNVMHVSFGYAHRNCFADVERLPLSLTQGDVAKNLQGFLAGPPPSAATVDPVAIRIYNSGKMDFPATCRSLKLLRDAPGSAQMTEKSHVQGKFLKQYHGRILPATLQLRASICDARVLFRMTKPEKALFKLKSELHRTLQKGTTKYTSRHLFIALYCRERKGEFGNGGAPNHLIAADTAFGTLACSQQTDSCDGGCREKNYADGKSLHRHCRGKHEAGATRGTNCNRECN